MTLLFALLALLVLTFGAVALIRTIDGGVLALGNLAFKQAGLVANARGADAAEVWLTARMGTATLDADQAAQGYYATSRNNLDPTGSSIGSATLLPQVDWDGNGCVVNGQNQSGAGCVTPSAAITVNGDQVRYVITRLCSLAAATSTAGNVCEYPPLANSGSAVDDMGGGVGYPKSERPAASAPSPYFRIVTRSLGPNGTVSFTETLVHY